MTVRSKPVIIYTFIFLFLEKEKMIEHKAEHELGVINSIESALIEQHHDMAQNELLQHSELLNEIPAQHQPVIVRPSPTKLSRILLEEEDGKYMLYFY